jgi:hypothetical protein
VSPWHAGPTAGHQGLVEMHPVDWIVRLRARPPGLRKTGRWLACATFAGAADVAEASVSVAHTFAPSGSTRRVSVRDVKEIVDGRFSDMATLIPHSRASEFDGARWKRSDEEVEAIAKVTGTTERQGRFKASYIVSWRETDTRDEVWVDDALPAGASAQGSEPWSWITDDPRPFTGSQSHTSASAVGMHQHYFEGATAQLAVGAFDVLFAMVYLDPDPADAVSEVMLQWNDGSWEHRAYWGDDLIPWGVDGTASRLRMGELPESGAWIRLEVPAAAVELAGRTVNGMAFTLWSGRAAWDYAGKMVVQPPPTFDAAFVAQTVPNRGVWGDEIDVSVTVRNTGITTWTLSDGIELAAPSPPTKWDVPAAGLPVASVPPNQEVTFDLTVKAPATPPVPAQSTFHWRMRRAGGIWFGASTPSAHIAMFSAPIDS